MSAPNTDGPGKSATEKTQGNTTPGCLESSSLQLSLLEPEMFLNEEKLAGSRPIHFETHVKF